MRACKHRISDDKLSKQMLPTALPLLSSFQYLHNLHNTHTLSTYEETSVNCEIATLEYLAVLGGCWISICSPICFNTSAFLPSVSGKCEGI